MNDETPPDTGRSEATESTEPFVVLEAAERRANAGPAASLFWAERRHQIRTAAGQWIPGKDAVVRGRSLLFDCLESMTLCQLHVLEVTGRSISRALATWIEGTIFFTSYPDPRIWCNTLGALCGTEGTTPVAAHAVGCLAADSRAYASRVQYLAADTISRLSAEAATGVALSHMVERYPKRQGIPSISGFARPLHFPDERIAPGQQLAQRLGLEEGAQMAFARRLSSHLEAHYGLGMNSAAYVGAFMLDQGFSPFELYMLSAGRVSIGVMSCYAERVGEPSHSFLPLRCDDIEYRGPSQRALK